MLKYIVLIIMCAVHSTSNPISALSVFSHDSAELRMGKVKKFERPLLVQDRNWEVRIDNGYPNVMRNSKNQYQLWYGTCLETCAEQYLLYANSSDGLNWEKPNLNIFEFKGSTQNNIVLQGGGLGIYNDVHEKNVSRRYKISGGAPEACFGSTCVSGTASSPNGLTNWTDIKSFNFQKPWRADCHTNLFYDEMTQKYVMTTREYTSESGRDIGIATSDDFNWTNSKSVSVFNGTLEYQLYSQITFRFLDILLGIVMVYDAETGNVGPNAGHVHCRLAWSRDLEAGWSWVDAKNDFIPAGSQGSFDSHVCFAAHLPIEMEEDGTHRIYYMGGNGPHSGARNSSLGLAILDRNRFVGISPSTNDSVVVSEALTLTSSTIRVTLDVFEDTNVHFEILLNVSGASVLTSKPIHLSVTDYDVDFGDDDPLGPFIGSKIYLRVRCMGENFVLYTVEGIH